MKTIKKVSASYQGDTPIATSITSSSTNSEVAGAKAVYDLISKPYGKYTLASNILVTPNTSYVDSPVKVILAETTAMDSNYISYNTTTGVFTVNKAGEYKFTLRTQLRGSTNDSTNLYVMKGFAVADATNLATTYVICNQQGKLEDWSTLYDVGSQTFSLNDTFAISAYCFVRSGQIGSYQMSVQASNRTTVEIEYIGEVTATRSLNAPLMNTGSLVGLGDKAEVTDETLEKTKLDEVTDKDVGEKTTEVKEEIKDEKGSGDNE